MATRIERETIRRKPSRGRGAIGALLALLALLLCGNVSAQPADEADPAGADAASERENTDEPDPMASPEGVGCEGRGPFNIVMAYDGGKYFRYVEEQALAATEALSSRLCIDDTVRLATFHNDVDWISSPLVVANQVDRDALALAFDKRKSPDAHHSINDTLVKRAFEYWDETELTEGEIPALFIFTDTIESDAPSRSQVADFAWNAMPSFLRGRMFVVVTLLDRKSATKEPLIYVMSAPDDFRELEFPKGAVTSYDDVFTAFEPEPEPVAATPRKEPAQQDLVKARGEELRASEGAWYDNPLWLGLAIGGGVLLLVFVFLLGRRRPGDDPDGPTSAAERVKPREVTFVLWDRLAKQVVREETRTLEYALRVGPSSGADFVVPGPYSLELENSNGGGPLVRSSNMLGVDLLRSGGRRLTLNEHESIPLRSGDRVDIGGGHEVEVVIR